MESEGSDDGARRKYRNSIMKQRILVVFGLVEIVLRCTLTMNDFQGLMMQPEGGSERAGARAPDVRPGGFPLRRFFRLWRFPLRFVLSYITDFLIDRPLPGTNRIAEESAGVPVFIAGPENFACSETAAVFSFRFFNGKKSTSRAEKTRVARCGVGDGADDDGRRAAAPERNGLARDAAKPPAPERTPARPSGGRAVRPPPTV
ncbi:hypothetical protein EVAR_57369_1 [Eumeta japonica]|uniref:Uncharacterized protein n=1 Tax=Eumeta variegata TaxID=151549 RepID=A0A4C1ZEN4_EUMVA|nr:hypothetical protein EVAR_57369_1 [Eumeta japonica]